jgi:membrane protease YdiL (CAAX protease family)
VKAPGSITLFFLGFVLLLMPALGVLSWLRLRDGKPLPPKKRRYRSMIAVQVLLFLLTAIAAKQNGVAMFGTVSPPLWIWLAVAAYVALVGVRARLGVPKLPRERRQKLHLTLPENPSEMPYWVVISLLAGVTEEYAYRGVAYTALNEMTGSLAVSLSICVLAFAIAHMMQGWRGTLGVAYVALLCHLTVFFTQTLSVVMTFHVAYDLVLGIAVMPVLMGDTTVNDHEMQ